MEPIKWQSVVLLGRSGNIYRVCTEPYPEREIDKAVKVIRTMDVVRYNNVHNMGPIELIVISFAAHLSLPDHTYVCPNDTYDPIIVSLHADMSLTDSDTYKLDQIYYGSSDLLIKRKRIHKQE